MGSGFSGSIFYRLLYVCVVSTIGFQVQDAVVWGTLPYISPELRCHIDHERRQMCRIGDPYGGDIHEVFQTSVLFGIPEVTLELEP
jgi:hypothetical protein